VPQVHLFLQENDCDYLLMSALPGLDTSDPAYGVNLPAMVRELAAGLRRLHSVPIQHCPFDESLNGKLIQARARTVAGLVDATEFHEQFQGRTAPDLLAELEATRPSTEDLVFTHGDYCLPNILLENGKLSGFIDLGRAGVADRYQDLALATQSLKRNFGAAWLTLFLAAYDIEADPNKLRYYQMLDEFF
jgi:aminoglycoside phosphotransferase